jgi:hypothetical protein
VERLADRDADSEERHGHDEPESGPDEAPATAAPPFVPSRPGRLEDAHGA